MKYPTLVATAEDLSQDALVRFMRAVATGRVDSQSRPDLYLLKTLERLCIDMLRHHDMARAASVGVGVEVQEADLGAVVAGRVDAGDLVRRALEAALAAGDLTAVAVLQSWKDAAHRFGDPTLAEVRTVSGRSIPTIRSVLEALRRWADSGEGQWDRL
jgi:DNA-directed RNA polymerase specialized sigma24 family protein